MDLSVISAIATSIRTAKELGSAAIGVRDFNQMAAIVSKLNDQLLNAQDRLFELNIQLLTLQNENFETTKKLAEVKKTLEERGRYSLFTIANGVHVYRSNVSPVDSNVPNPVSAEPEHYVCQICFDKGVKAILMRRVNYGSVIHTCPNCSVDYYESKVPIVRTHPLDY